MIHGGYRAAHLELWLGAKSPSPSGSNGHLMPRLDAATRVQVLTEGKGIHQRTACCSTPSTTTATGGGYWLPPIPPARPNMPFEDGAYYLLRELSAYPQAHPRQACAALLTRRAIQPFMKSPTRITKPCASCSRRRYHDLLTTILERPNHHRQVCMAPPSGLWEKRGGAYLPGYPPGHGWPTRYLRLAPTPPAGPGTDR